MKKPEKMKLYEKIIITIHIVILVLVFVGPFIFYITAPEFDIVGYYYEECIKLRKTEGYPEDLSREYCSGPSAGCEKRVYSENCNQEVYCCFATIEEDKKWNYLDYDKNRNKKK